MGRLAQPGCPQIHGALSVSWAAWLLALCWSSAPLSVQIESLFTAALGLPASWQVAKVDLDTAKRRIDFEVINTAKGLTCPSCENVQASRLQASGACVPAHGLRIHTRFLSHGIFLQTRVSAAAPTKTIITLMIEFIFSWEYLNTISWTNG